MSSVYEVRPNVIGQEFRGRPPPAGSSGADRAGFPGPAPAESDAMPLRGPGQTPQSCYGGAGAYDDGESGLAPAAAKDDEPADSRHPRSEYAQGGGFFRRNFFYIAVALAVVLIVIFAVYYFWGRGSKNAHVQEAETEALSGGHEREPLPARENTAAVHAAQLRKVWEQRRRQMQGRKAPPRDDTVAAADKKAAKGGPKPRERVRPAGASVARSDAAEPSLAIRDLGYTSGESRRPRPKNTQDKTSGGPANSTGAGVQQSFANAEEEQQAEWEDNVEEGQSLEEVLSVGRDEDEDEAEDEDEDEAEDEDEDEAETEAEDGAEAEAGAEAEDEESPLDDLMK